MLRLNFCATHLVLVNWLLINPSTHPLSGICSGFILSLSKDKEADCSLASFEDTMFQRKKLRRNHRFSDTQSMIQ